MGENPCFMANFPPEELWPSQQTKTTHQTMRTTPPLASFFTYTIGKNLYVPLTSRSNARTLPETRGPNFLLGADVVAALCRVRDEEQGAQQWAPWCLYLDTQENKQKLPVPLDIIDSLPKSTSDRLPRIQDLCSEISEAMKIRSEIESIVLSGEGEPTLRLDDMLKLVDDLKNSSDGGMPQIRLTSNGLVSSPKSVVEQLKACGIASLSVALMTADPAQYEELMAPIGPSSGHSQVCHFIEHAINAGLEVETTGVDRPDVDKAMAEELSRSLKVLTPIRWRPYFP
jgi:pyruvate-formate lyase-activating enzyme